MFFFRGSNNLKKYLAPFKKVNPVEESKKWHDLICTKGKLGGGNANIFFSPRIPGEMIQFDEHIFQRGWNQPENSYNIDTQIYGQEIMTSLSFTSWQFWYLCQIYMGCKI